MRRSTALFLLAALPTVRAGATGPDLLITDMTWPAPGGDVVKAASENGESAYSAPTFTCNIGDEDADWHGGTVDHPLIAQNLYRLHNGRFEQIGLGWPKHAAAVVAQQPSCGPCPFQGQVQFFLAPGCMDPYDADTNATQSRLSPRSDVDPVNGQFAFPFDASVPPSGLDRRLRVANDDIDPALRPGARFFIEAQMIAKDDAAAGNDLNNASHREIAPGAFVDGGFELAPVNPAVSGEPAIMSWGAIDPGVRIERADIPGDGSFYVGSRAYDHGDGTWGYEYAVLNFNSARAAGGFAVPLAGAGATGAGFHDVHHHSGEPYSGADWTASVDGAEIGWATEPHALNADANALRWGTLYNFRFTSDRAPGDADARLELFAPGAPSSVSVAIVGPAPSAGDPADLDGDGCVGSADLAVLLAAWGGAGASDLDHDGAVGASDLAVLLAAWGGCD